MHQHVGYWTDLLGKGIVLVFGPVADPAGSYGIAVIERESEAEARELATNDPVIRANAGFAFELYFMPQCVFQTAKCLTNRWSRCGAATLHRSI